MNKKFSVAVLILIGILLISGCSQIKKTEKEKPLQKNDCPENCDCDKKGNRLDCHSAPICNNDSVCKTPEDRYNCPKDCE